MTRKFDLLHCTHWNGPLPMIGGELGSVWMAVLEGIFAQMCLGSTGTSARLASKAGWGAEQTTRTV